MARIRTVKPELFKHEDLYDLEYQTKLPIRVAFIGLFTCCDKAGRFKWRPRALKLDILPYDDCDFSRVLDALTTRGFVIKYVSEGVEYGCIPSFPRHQVINNRETESELPDPANSLTIDATTTREPRDDNASQEEGKGREGKGKEQEGKELTSQATEYSEDFEQLWEQYPKRPGASKKETLKAYQARLKKGATHLEMLDGVQRYASYVVAMKTDPQYIKQPATFLGPDDHFRANWTATRAVETIAEANARITREVLGGTLFDDGKTIDMEG